MNASGVSAIVGFLLAVAGSCSTSSFEVEPTSSEPVISVQVCVAMSGEVVDEDGIFVRMFSREESLHAGDCFNFSTWQFAHHRELTVRDVAPHCTVRGADESYPADYLSVFREVYGAQLTVQLECGPLPDLLEGTLRVFTKSSPEVVGLTVGGGQSYQLQMTREPSLENTIFETQCYEGGLTILMPIGDQRLGFHDVADQPLAMESSLSGTSGAIHAVTIGYGKISLLSVRPAIPVNCYPPRSRLEH